jgi:prevent-host-death family protein
MSDKSIPAGEFKAKCLGLLDDVNRTGEPLVITKHGKPIARLIPIRPGVDEVRKTLRFDIAGDIVEPLDADDWGDLA